MYVQIRTITIKNLYARIPVGKREKTPKELSSEGQSIPHLTTSSNIKKNYPSHIDYIHLKQRLCSSPKIIHLKYGKHA